MAKSLVSPQLPLNSSGSVVMVADTTEDSVVAGTLPTDKYPVDSTNKLQVKFPDSVARDVAMNSFAHIGDSRTASINIGTAGYKQGLHWFNQANAINGQNMVMAGNFGISGNRSDEYLATNFNACLNAGSGWIVFGFPGVNDITQAPNTYIDRNGNLVTIDNVAQFCANNILSAAKQALNAGKRVIIVAEPGSTSLTNTIVSGYSKSQIQALFELNERLETGCDGVPGLYFLDMNSATWDGTASTTTMTFKAGVFAGADGTHPTNYGGYLYGKVFAAFIKPFVPTRSPKGYSVLNNNTNNPYQLATNPMFTTLTGGTTAGSGTLSSGTVPSGIKLVIPANISVAVTSAANASGYGNDITLTITASAAGTVAFAMDANNAQWSLGDKIQSGWDVSVASGSSNAAVYSECQYNVNNPSSTTYNQYDMYPGSANTNGPTEAYSYSLASFPTTGPANPVSKGFISSRLNVQFSAAGNATVTIRGNQWLRKRQQ